MAKHLMLSKVRRHFEKFQAQIAHRRGPAAVLGPATVEVNSVITGKQTRDEDLRSDNFFAAATHPVIANGSTGIRRDGGDLVIDGELTIRGVTRPVSSALAAAELRLLPLLSTHLTFPQIGGEMFLSRFTVKSQAMSIYRKLGACSRSQAVTRSRELGLLER